MSFTLTAHRSMHEFYPNANANANPNPNANDVPTPTPNITLTLPSTPNLTLAINLALTLALNFPNPDRVTSDEMKASTIDVYLGDVTVLDHRLLTK